MSRINDTSNIAKLEDHATLEDTELNAVTGGTEAAQFRGRYQLRLDEAHQLLS
jgi:hypothetical protein